MIEFCSESLPKMASDSSSRRALTVLGVRVEGAAAVSPVLTGSMVDGDMV